MQSGVGLQGRVDITIKKADGQVFKQTIYNDLDLNIIKELADKIDLVGYAYDSTYQPQHIKIYAKGHAGGDDAEFSTLALGLTSLFRSVGYFLPFQVKVLLPLPL